MSLAIMREEILKVLEDNIYNNINPGAVCSDLIAKKLNVSLPELIEVLKAMNEKGVIVSNIDNEYSIITSKGLDLVRQHQCM